MQRDPERVLPPEELSKRLDLLAQRMLTLVDSFVALARAESVDPGTFETFDLRDAVQDAYDEVWAAAQSRDIQITLRVQEEPCVVSGDRHLLARAVINLLSNAVKFSNNRDSIDLVCGAEHHSALIIVADQGPGIDVARQESLFRRFSRPVHRDVSDPGGAGLGLAFVRVVAEKHRGQVTVEPNLPRGASFRLRLPLADSAVGRPREASSAAST
jgi:signal transduction histidine kinase